MTSLRASYPMLRDRFSTFIKLPYGVESYYNEAVSMLQANGYMFLLDEWGMYASSDGITFLPVLELMGGKITAVAYGGGKYVFVGLSWPGIWTSDGPDEYFNWNFQEQTPASSVGFLGVCFDGVAFVACGEGMTETGNKPIFNRALATDVTEWFEVEGASLASWISAIFIWRIRSHGGRLVAVGGAQGDYAFEDYRATDVIQISDDNGETWENITPPGTQPRGPGVDSGGYGDLEYVDDRWLALSTEEEGTDVRFIQSLDGEEWELISDRFVTPLFGAQQPEPAERYNRGALLNDNGRIVCLLPQMELQIGKMGTNGPDNFERVPFVQVSQESEKGMLLFKGNYYMMIEVEETEVPAYIIAFTPRIPVVG